MTDTEAQEIRRGRTAGGRPHAATESPDVPIAADAVAYARRRSDGARAPLIPDCCNAAIVTRVLIYSNVAAALLASVLGPSVMETAQRFIQIAGVLDPSVLVSLALLCWVRDSAAGRGPGAQWATGVGIPTVVTVAVCLLVAPALRPEAAPGDVAGWALASGLLAAGWSAAIIEFLRLRTAALSPSLSEARLQALQARIRPHFLFNSLNTVLALLRSEPRRAERTLEDLADLFRVFMRDTRELVLIGEEIETCRQYLAIEKLRLGDRLSVRWQVEALPDDALVPALLLQPLVENAIHHGIEPSGGHGVLAVTIRQAADRIRVEIVNPWDPAWPHRPGNQMGLSNVRERLMLLYDTQAVLKTTASAGQFRLLLEFPCRKERRRRGA